MKLSKMLGISVILMTTATTVMAEDVNKLSSRAKLSGFQEVPAILTAGNGVFKAKVDRADTMLAYTLTFSDLSTAARVAHIHFGQPGVNGGVMAFLCGGGTKPACPEAGGTVTGTIIASDIMALPAQGITAGNFADFLTVLRSGNAYVNVHTASHPSGEIRGQIGHRFPINDMN